MPTNKAILIPQWVKDLKSQVSDPCNLLHLLPGLMHWRNPDFMEDQLMTFTPREAVRHQMHSVIVQLKEQLEQLLPNQEPHPLVACISLSHHIRNEIIVTFTEDVKRPEAKGCMVLRIDKDGTIVGVIREYTMSHTATPQWNPTAFS